MNTRLFTGLLLSLLPTSYACSDATPIESRPESNPAQFALSTESARSFDLAIADARQRILPALTAIDAPASLDAVLDGVSAGIAARNADALRRALSRAEQYLTQFADDETAAAVGMELDAIRLILEQARPIANGTIRSR